MMQQQPAPAQGAQEEQGQDPFKAMVIGVDQALTKIAQVAGKQSPQHGEAIAQLGGQFRDIIGDLMGGGGAAKAPQPVPQEAGAAKAQPY